MDRSTTPVQDRRVRRSRAALMKAAVDLVSEQGSAAVSLSDIAKAADVSRQLVYQHFGDRDTLLLEAALDLARRELLAEGLDTEPPGRGRALATARHFAEHRAFYRAMLTGPTAFAMNRVLSDLLLPINRRSVDLGFPGVGDREAEDLARFFTGGGAALFNAWVIDGEAPLDPEAFADRLLRLGETITATPRQEATER